MEVVQRCNVDQVDGKGVIAYKFAKFLISSETLLMSWNVKLYGIFGRMLLKSCK
ncbi:hypothetical protein D3C79_1013530 [compost metagenome]